MICSYCGTQLPDDVTFCGNCGSRVAAESASSAQVQQGQSQGGGMPMTYSTPHSFPNAGSAQQGGIPAEQPDKVSVPGVVFGFIFPIVGLILFLAWKGKRPVAAKYSGIAAIVGFCLGVLANLSRFAVS